MTLKIFKETLSSSTLKSLKELKSSYLTDVSLGINYQDHYVHVYYFGKSHFEDLRHHKWGITLFHQNSVDFTYLEQRNFFS